MNREQQMALSRQFGPLETTIGAAGREHRLHLNLVDFPNLDPDRAEQLIEGAGHSPARW